MESVEEITSLETRPGRRFRANDRWNIVPDAFVYKIGVRTQLLAARGSLLSLAL